ncbi:MAG: hypothetical protein WGN25_13980 [Candidatus Electrothrix sp. GW3-4]|uniref:hypothetical protein n=1 Tax=Candidatus Electrothrix sp. GW3-4 TaxID=3126740 RepID=UPI0030D54890
MIPVTEQPEPADFDAKVRRKGLAFLQKKGIAPDQPVPEGITLKPCWRDCLDDLHVSYKGCCAYLAVYIERVTGGVSADHFTVKVGTSARLAHEWSNYRLACSIMNSRKGRYDDVLDPFHIKDNWFSLELVSGRIYPNPSLPFSITRQIQETIDRLRLDDAGNRAMRSRHYQEYIEGFCTTDFLKRRSPFVYTEACRQNLL